MRRNLRPVGLAWWALGLLLIGVPSLAGVLEVPLIPELDQFGSQIETVQGYDNGSDLLTAFAIYDTGASVATLSLSDRMAFDLGGSTIPIKVPGGAQADGIGGALIGDVSQPGALVADGLHAVTITTTGGFPEVTIDLANGASVPGVQLFVGASPGSQSLPTITGTPIHYPSAAETGGAAAKVNMLGYALDFGELFPEFGELFEGVIFYLPDLSFVPSGATITSTPDSTEVVRLPMTLLGDVNHPTPGDIVTVAPNPVQTGVGLQHEATPGQVLSVDGKTFLFDTGAQMSIISSDIALGLGLDLDNPETTIDVQGAAGLALEIPGYTIDVLDLPRDDDGNGVIDGTLRFTDAPIYVLDLGFGIDGILGMNLFNTASQMLYDPNDPQGASVRLTFLADPYRELPTAEELQAMQLFALLMPGMSGALGMGANLPGFQMDLDVAGVPEPSALLLLAGGAMTLIVARRRRG